MTRTVSIIFLTAWLFLDPFWLNASSSSSSSKSGCGGSSSSSGGGGANCGAMNATACSAFGLVNDQRVAAGLPALKVNATAVSMAQEQSDRMANCNFIAHDDPACQGHPAETFYQRSARWGLWAGENAAGDAGGPAATVNLWMGSPGHKANILSPNYTSGGMGYSVGGQYGATYDEVFTSP